MAAALCREYFRTEGADYGEAVRGNRTAYCAGQTRQTKQTGLESQRLCGLYIPGVIITQKKGRFKPFLPPSHNLTPILTGGRIEIL